MNWFYTRQREMALFVEVGYNVELVFWTDYFRIDMLICKHVNQTQFPIQ